MTGPLARPLPMQVSHTSTDVTITVPADMARDIAAVWSTAHVNDPLLAETRPDWHRDVIAIVSHAVMADQAAGGGPVPVEAVFLPHPPRTDRPRLEAVQS